MSAEQWSVVVLLSLNAGVLFALVVMAWLRPSLLVSAAFWLARKMEARR